MRVNMTKPKFELDMTQECMCQQPSNRLKERLTKCSTKSLTKRLELKTKDKHQAYSLHP